MPEISHPDSQLRNPDVRYEQKDVSARGVVFWGVVLVGLVGVTAFLMAKLFDYFQAREAAEKKSAFPLAAEGRAGRNEDDRLPKEPRLEGIPYRGPDGDLDPRYVAGTPEARQAEIERRLGDTGWIDEKAGIVFIPVEEAMKLAVRERDKYLPARKQEKQP